MSITVNIEGENENGEDTIAEVIVRRGCKGVRVFTESARNFTTFTRAFSNDNFGINMAQNVAFTGNPTIIHAGVNSGALLTGTTTGTTASHLIDSGETFSNISVGHSVKNTTSGTEYALVTAVASNDLTLDTDILVSGENYEINPIWVGSAIAGTWNFADAGKITITSADNNDEALFDNDTNQNWNVANFSALTAKIDLDVYDPVNNNILIKFSHNDIQNGDVLDLNDFIDTGDFSEQSFSIPIGMFNFGDDLINEMNLCIVRTGGAKPTVKFDDFQWEEIGNPIVFEMRPASDEVISIDELIFSIQDDITSIATIAGATENFTTTKLSPDAFLGVSKLTNGMNFRRVQDNIVRTSLVFQQISDFLIAGGVIKNHFSDDTKTFLSITVEFLTPVVLFGSKRDFLSFTINDNLGDLTLFNAFARGGIET